MVGKCASEACGEATGFTRWCWAAGECFVRAPSPRGIAHGLRYPPFAPLPFNIPMVSATPASPLHPPPKSVQRRNLCMFLHLRPHKAPGAQKVESGERGVAHQKKRCLDFELCISSSISAQASSKLLLFSCLSSLFLRCRSNGIKHSSRASA